MGRALNRRGFLGTLVAIPAALKAIALSPLQPQAEQYDCSAASMLVRDDRGEGIRIVFPAGRYTAAQVASEITSQTSGKLRGTPLGGDKVRVEFGDGWRAGRSSVGLISQEMSW